MVGVVQEGDTFVLDVNGERLSIQVANSNG